MGGSIEGTGCPDPLENYKLLFFFLEIPVRNPLEKQLDPSGPIASWGGGGGGRSIRPTVKYVDDLQI